MDTKNVLMAVILSTIIIVGWQIFVVDPELKKERETTSIQKSTSTENNTSTGKPTAPSLSVKTKELAEIISNKSAMAIGLGKKLFYQQLNMDLGAAYDAANETIVCNIDSHDAREGIDAFIEKRKPKWNQ